VPQSLVNACHHQLGSPRLVITRDSLSGILALVSLLSCESSTPPIDALVSTTTRTAHPNDNCDDDDDDDIKQARMRSCQGILTDLTGRHGKKEPSESEFLIDYLNSVPTMSLDYSAFIRRIQVRKK